MSTLFTSKHSKKRQKLSEAPVNNHEVTQIVNNVKTGEQRRSNETEVATSFAECGLDTTLLNTVKSFKFNKPTPVQARLIPAILRDDFRQNILALSATGSGKTAAYALPILQLLSQDPYGIYALILTPTRELAQQVFESFKALGARHNCRVTCVTGGGDMVRQNCELSRLPHVVVATPGRLAELIRTSYTPLRLNKLRFIVLDEADRLLATNSGFERDIQHILSHRPGERCQTLLFSATLTASLQKIIELSQLDNKQLLRFDISEDLVSTTNTNKLSSEEEVNTIISLPAGLKQQYIFMPTRVRDTYLVTALRRLMKNGGCKSEDPNDSGWRLGDTDDAANTNTNSLDPEEESSSPAAAARSAVVFVSTCERAARVEGMLHELGVDCVALHSILSQDRRNAALGKFKSQRIRVLVATDVASRGLDIPEVDLVLNSELPRKPEDYIHRVGRTARAGRRGLAVSLVSESDVALVHAIEKVTGIELEKCEEVTDKEALRLLNPVAKATRLAKIKLAELGFDDAVLRRLERRERDRKERKKRKAVL